MDETQTRAWIALMSLSQILASSLDNRLREIGLTTFELNALVVLDEAADRVLGITEIAERSHSPVPRMSKVITRLEARGLVRRSASTTDARAVCIHLTPEGRRVMLKALPVYSAEGRRLVIDRLDARQLTDLADLLQDVVIDLDPQGPLARFTGPVLPIRGADRAR